MPSWRSIDWRTSTVITSFMVTERLVFKSSGIEFLESSLKSTDSKRRPGTYLEAWVKDSLSRYRDTSWSGSNEPVTVHHTDTDLNPGCTGRARETGFLSAVDFRSRCANNNHDVRPATDGSPRMSTSLRAISRYIWSNCWASYLHTGLSGSRTPLSRLIALSAIVPMDGWVLSHGVVCDSRNGSAGYLLSCM